MAEPLPALAPPNARRPAARKPRLPHPHLAPAEPPVPAASPGIQAETAASTPAESWTPAAVPMARPAGRHRKGSQTSRRTPAERALRNALRFGFFVNGAALLVPRLFPTGAFQGWRYGGDDFLLAAAVLLSGQILLMLGRRGD